MYKPHIAKIDFYYMNIAAFVIFGAIAAYIFLGHLGTGAKYILLTNFGLPSTGIVTSIEARKNPSFQIWSSRAVEEFRSSEYFFKYTDHSGTTYENSIWLLDDFAENKFAKNGKKRTIRTHVYKIGQSEEIKYLEK